MARLLLVEDDADIADPLQQALRREGHEVEHVADGRTALRRALSGTHDLVVLDLGLPGMDGLDVCRRIRQSGASVPVLVLTARADEIDTVVGLDAGADDYVTKPFRLAELLARVRALLRRQAATDDEVRVVEAAGVRVDRAAHRAWRDGRELALTTKEFGLLALLVAHAGEVVTREEIMEQVWDPEWFGPTKTLDMHVSWLRRKLGDDGLHLITTVRGVGYRFEQPG